MQLIFPVTLAKITLKKPYLVTFFFIVQHCSLFMGIIFCSSVALVWIFNARSDHNFITNEPNIPVNLVPFFNDASFLFCRFLKSEVTNELKSIFLWKSKKVSVIYSKQCKTLLLIAWSTYIWRTTTATIKRKKRVIYDIGSHLNRIRFI